MQLLYNILILLDVLASILKSPIILRFLEREIDIVSEFLSSFKKHNNVKFQRKLQKYQECKDSGSLRPFFGLNSFNSDLNNLGA